MRHDYLHFDTEHVCVVSVLKNYVKLNWQFRAWEKFCLTEKQLVFNRDLAISEFSESIPSIICTAEAIDR